MRIGVDFDNTIACYDGAFHTAASERGLIPSTLGHGKNDVRDFLNANGGKDAFTELQGYIYGARMDLASLYPGVHDFFTQALKQGHEIFVISHKTARPLMGPPYDLHAAARDFLATKGLAGPNALITDDQVFFELTKEAKIERIAALGLDAFVDDLPEILSMPGFPARTSRLLFDPDARWPDGRQHDLECVRHASWKTLAAALLQDGMADASSIDPQSIADGLVCDAGLGTALRLQPLVGGRNNRVFAVDLASGRRVVMKIYFRHCGDARDRLRAEWRFVQHAHARAPNRVAAALACDRKSGAALYELVEGERYAQIDATAVEAAAEFFRLVAAPGRAGKLDIASEACFSLAEHMTTVERRVARLSSARIEGPYADEAAAFIAGHVAPAWWRVRMTMEADCAALGLDLHAQVAASDIIASPSDFGFHNAVRSTDGPVFIDFEYAGQDDPAKLVCDFFCQPAVPVPSSLHETFLAETLDRLGLSPHRQRAEILLDAYRIKWIAILLNDFMPVDESRRAFSVEDDRAARRLHQLNSARDRLSAIETIR